MIFEPVRAMYEEFEAVGRNELLKRLPAGSPAGGYS
jgi:hypothetical protein